MSDHPDPPVIETRELTRRFGAVTAVDRLSVRVGRGELFGLVGPDGAGKTTTLRMLAGILPPSSGDALVAGRSVARDPEAVKPRIAYMSQRFGLYGDLTVLENLGFYADLFEVPARERAARIERLLGFAMLGDFRHRRAAQLSGGMKQKLGLACALVHAPEILLLDEPTNGVDPVSRRDFWAILYEMLRERVTVVLTTAYLDEAERCHRVGLLHHGRLLAIDNPDRLRARVEGQVVEILVDDPWRACERLRGAPGVRAVIQFGQRVHATLEDLDRDLPAALSALEAGGLRASDARPILPSLEDAFIALVPPGPAP